jgi:hypothetical protein
MSEPRILFGLGATKAGTSWLHNYLSQHPDCAMPHIKELHFFDTIEDQSQDWRLGMLARHEASLIEHQAKLIESGRPRKADRIARQLVQLQRYTEVVRTGDERKFRAFLEEIRGDRALVGDITPAYALLPEARLSQMAALGPAVRFVYLLRDPVDRLWSNVRMIAHRKSNGDNHEPIAKRIFDRVIAGEDAENFRRSDYRAILSRLTAAVPGPQVLIEFFEELFSEETMRRVCDFLGIGYAEPAYEKVVHKGRAELALDDDRRRAARAFLAPQYDYVTARMGGVPASWQRGDL